MGKARISLSDAHIVAIIKDLQLRVFKLENVGEDNYNTITICSYCSMDNIWSSDNDDKCRYCHNDLDTDY